MLSELCAGSFVLGTALLVVGAYGSWLYTKWKLNVKDGKEYAEKMRNLTPETKKQMDESFVGQGMKRFRSGFSHWIEGNTSLQRFGGVMANNMGGIQRRITGTSVPVKEPGPPPPGSRSE